VPLAALLAESASDVLGEAVAARRGGKINLLIKFTQALGNSFQTHIKADLHHERWKPKPESWYYFEPGYITLGVKATQSWEGYERAVRDVARDMQALSTQVRSGSLDIGQARQEARAIVTKYDPWQYVNAVTVGRDELVDLSAGGLHHSWEEDASKAPLGNVLLELQSEALDSVSTFRCFDKGKIGDDGRLRDIHLDEYFEFIDRSPEANNPAQHMRQPKLLKQDENYCYEKLLESSYYNLDRLNLLRAGATYVEKLDQYKHLFVKVGRVNVAANGHEVTVGTGHSCFIPANAKEVQVTSLDAAAVVLVSY
jgi:mannose-6-phosphate isomerase class I